MRVSEAKKLFKELTQEYFAGAWVTFSRQSRVAKPEIPLVSITPGNVNRPLSPTYGNAGGEVLGYYLSRIQMTVDLFTRGKPVTDDETGKTVAYENTAVDDMLAFADFLNSPHTVDWSNIHDVTLLIEGDVQDLTGLVNDTNYEFRSRLVVSFYFTQRAVGQAAVATEESIQLAPVEPPTGPDPGTEGPGGDTPGSGTPGSGEGSTPGGIQPKPGDTVIVPQFEQTSSGGGSEELAKEMTGYFTEVEIKEEKA
mgnify:CR=1 FL=1